MKSFSGFLAVAATAGIVVMFFMPWVNVDANLARSVQGIGAKIDGATGKTGIFTKFTNEVSGALSKAGLRVRLAAISGYDIARSNKDEFVGLVGNLMVFVGQESKDPRNVKFLYLLPVIGVVLGLLIQCGGKAVIVSKAAGFASVVIGGFMLFKLVTTPLVNDLAHAELLWGIWTTAGLFVVLGIVGLVRK